LAKTRREKLSDIKQTSLAMGAAFAAPILRKVNLDTFGFYFVGKTSKGKTLCLKVAGSVAGLNAEGGPTSWDGTPTGFQHLALGHRDNVMPLDDTSAIEGDAKKRREFAKLTIFSLAKNKQKIRSGQYDRLTDAVRSDCELGDIFTFPPIHPHSAPSFDGL
jgi:uncharacterized protein (DUF927 family)